MLIIIRGLPGSGKSTLASKFASFNHYEADMYFMYDGKYEFDYTKLGEAHRWCQNNVEYSLTYKHDTIVSNTFTTNKEMLPYLEMAKKYQTEVLIIECHGKFGSIHNVPEEAIERMSNRWEKVEGDYNILTYNQFSNSFDVK